MMVESRCAMTIVVRPLHNSAIAFWTSCSDSESSAAVASSSRISGASLDERAGDRDALALAAGQAGAVFAHQRVVALRAGGDELVRLRGLGGGDDFRLGCARPAERDVFADRGAEQEDILADIGDLASQRAAGNGSDVLTVDRDRALVDIVEAQDQAQDGRFSAARRADQRGHPAGFGIERDVAQDGLTATLVGKGDVPELHVRRGCIQRRQRAIGLLGRGLVDDLEQDADADHRGVEIEIQAGQPLGRLVCQQERGHEREEFARRRIGFDHAVAGIDHCQSNRDAGKRFGQRPGALAHARHLVRLPLDHRDVVVESARASDLPG